MRILLTSFFLFFHLIGLSQLTLVSWNIENLGDSKSDSTLHYIVQQLKNFDVVALQEVVANPSGPQTVAKIADALNRSGAKWNYAVSEPTQSSAYKTERYAFLWQTARVKLMSKPWLEQHYAQEIDREPYYATFQYQGKPFTVVNFHAITKKMQPETEIKYFKFLPERYPSLNLLFVGDFNCPETHTVFNPLKKMGYASVFKNQKTTLRSKCIEADCLASPFDNIFYAQQKIKIKQKGVILFYEDFPSLNYARKVSDHLPLWVSFDVL
jgi:endonuclease/exonuclease/phosphatase family metal-dependent hydrolase